MTVPSISVVLPTRNRAHLLPSAIESCLSQTCTDWELVIVDDASTDGTKEVVFEYVARDQRIKYLSSDGKFKLPGALNRGFATVQGTFLTWTSDDNLFEPEAFQVFLDSFRLRPDIDFFYSDELLIDEHGNVLGAHTTLPPEYLIEVCVVGGSFMYRRKVYEAIGDYATDLFLAEDYDYWLRIYLAGFRCARIARSLYRYRKHPDALGTSQIDLVKIKAAQVRERHLSKVGLFRLRAIRRLKRLLGLIEMPNRGQDARDPNL